MYPRRQNKTTPIIPSKLIENIKQAYIFVSAYVLTLEWYQMEYKVLQERGKIKQTVNHVLAPIKMCYTSTRQ